MKLFEVIYVILVLNILILGYKFTCHVWKNSMPEAKIINVVIIVGSILWVVSTMMYEFFSK